jgi:hypothetical protein
MKKLISIIGLLTLLLGGNAFGQEQRQAKDLYLSYGQTSSQGKPGAKLRLELLRNGERKFVSANTTFQNGDKVKFHFEVNFPAYVEIYNLGTSGKVQRLFPTSGAARRVNPTSDYVVPGTNTQWFEFSGKAGEERLTFVFSSAQIRPNSGSVTINPPRNQSRPNNSTEQALDDLNSRALQNGKDLVLTQTREESYIVASEQSLRRPTGFTLILKHR